MTSAALVTDVRPDPRDPRHRLSRLLDAGAAVPPPDDTGVLVARGRIEGSPVLAYCTDATLMGGAMGADGCARIVEAIDTAVAERVPVIGIWHSGGARLAEGVSALHGVGTVFAAMVRASGAVPQISVVVGPAAGGAAYGPALTDVVVMAGDGRVFVTGPDVIRTVTGEDVDAATLGGADTHGRRSGVAHVTTADEAGALVAARRIVGLAARHGRVRAPDRPDTDPGALLPERVKRAYDVRPVVDALLDADPDGAGIELAPRWAPNVVTRLGRLGGRSIGVVANNPLRLGGCLDSTSAEKAARFVRTCDAWGLPLLVLVDVPGYLPGVEQEFGGVVRRGAKLLHAFAEAVVPRVTVILRKSYGGAYVAMNSRSLGAHAVLAWPDAEVAVMAASAAVPILHRRRLAAAEPHERDALLAGLVAEQERNAGGLARATEIGVVDEVIAPVDTRTRVAELFAAAPAGRGRHGNIPL